MKKSLIVLMFCLVFLFLIINYNNKLEFKKNEIINNKSIYNLDKIIIIGDSRMEFINNKKDELNIPKNIIFIAKSGATISWLRESALPELNKVIKKNKKYKNHVIFNLGVNDLDNKIDIKELANEYYHTYKSVIKYNKDISFYFLSVNPIDENRIYFHFNINNKRTNKKIEKFNNYFLNFVNKDDLKNIKYCDSYNNLEFYLPDGLHYDTETDKKIIEYIIKKCIKIN